MRVLLGTSLVLGVIAGVDAFRGDHWDQFAILIVLAGLSLAGIVIETRRSGSVLLRPDLLAWVEDHASRTDDDPRRVVDRALAAYRSDLLPEADES